MIGIDLPWTLLNSGTLLSVRIQARTKLRCSLFVRLNSIPHPLMSKPPTPYDYAGIQFHPPLVLTPFYERRRSGPQSMSRLLRPPPSSHLPEIGPGNPATPPTPDRQAHNKACHHKNQASYLVETPGDSTTDESADISHDNKLPCKDIPKYLGRGVPVKRIGT